MTYDLDLLKPPSEWPKNPWEMKYENKNCENIFMVTSAFLSELKKYNMQPISDEIVLMASLYFDGLEKEKKKRREQCNKFNQEARNHLAQGDYQNLEKMIRRINENQTK